MRDDRRLLAALAGLFALGVAVRLPGALAFPLWQDEVASARVIVEPTLGGALARVAETESTPPLWYVLAWLAQRVAVPVEAVRILSVVFGAAAAPLAALHARRFLPLSASVLAGLLVAVSWQFVLRGHELRAYALLAFLALAFALLLERAVERPSLQRLALLAACAAAGLLTHYFFVLTLVTAILWIWTTAVARAARLRLGAALLLSVVPFLLWLPSFVAQYRNQRFDWIADFDILKAAYAYSTLFVSAGPLYVSTQNVDVGALEGIARLAALAAVLAGALVLARGSGRLPALLATVPVLLAAALWAAGANVFTTRNLLAAAPFAAVAIAAAVAALPRALATAAALVAVAVAATGVAQDLRDAPPPYDDVAGALVAEGWTAGDRVAIFGGAHELSFLGGIYALRGPIGWYLPGHPTLEYTDDRDACPALFVVAPERGAESDPITVDRAACTPDVQARVAGQGAFVFTTSTAR